ncbi:citrate lyase subunit beta / citryl-CoA lyase [Modicisalibacter muralis]|uniref:Citrate lyase subunit beta / citryl-CoA lyase n=1 Tax=Modicisalibacter muralis TaxID=119000 RepID=A0A1G9GWV1_9GAMM|nr:CoA ester lyase [Halomonas muralis]SDL05054.1 citrate lyase subunit beta / citryl-CoA lyase [Halomonas muralis]
MAHAVCRSALFVPATRAERIPKALASGADAVIVDLEDAVGEADKRSARQALEVFLKDTPDATFHVRINASTSRHFEDDLALCRRHDGIRGIVVPKAESVATLERVATCNKPLWPLIETARGLLALASLVDVAGVERLSFGALDLGLELGLTPGSEGAERLLDQARYQLRVHSTAAGLAAPLESVHPSIDDSQSIRLAAIRARDMGFAGMLCIHPRQLEPIHRAFSPSLTELAWAQRVLEAAERSHGAFSVDGQMVDAPVIERARRIMAISESVAGMNSVERD